MSDFESNYRKWHTYMSYAKSFVRIAACILVVWQAPYGSILSIFAFCFLIAEFIGIAEEWV